MTAVVSALAAFVLYAAGLAILFGARTRRHRSTSGSSGFAGFTTGRGGWAQVAGPAFAAALTIGVVSPLLAAGMPSSGVAGRIFPVVSLLGFVVALVGLVAAWRSQTAMGRSWRIGVDPSAHTELVTGGAFAMVRNPIFTSMIIAQAGVTMMAPWWLSIVGLGLLVLACQLQVRLVEEPYLLAQHGTAYARYASRTGRFLPWLGYLKSQSAPPTDAAVR